MVLRFRLATIAVVALAAGGCAMMQPPPQPDPTAQKLADLERRLAALERILASGSLIELTVQVDDLQRQSVELLGRTDALEHDAETTGARQRDLYVDLDNRLRNLEQRLEARPAAAATPGGVDESAGVPATTGSTDRASYEAAFELLKQQKYDAAGDAFAQFLKRFPDSQLADNAQYWLAESYYVRNQFDEALAQFQVVLSGYPRSRKLPDALLKIGYSNYALGRWDAARSALQRVTREFPDSTAAQLAQQRLTRMQDEGH